MAIDNVTFLNGIAKELSAEYNDRIPSATKENVADIGEILSQYPTTKNEFISALTNLVAKTVIQNRVYQTRYKFLHKGKLPYGTTIEMIVADIVKGKDFTENFGSANTDVGSLIGKETHDVKVQYIERNIRLKYKLTVSDIQLQGAFRSEDGLSRLVQALVTTVINGMEFDEEILINKALNGVEGGATSSVVGYDAMDDNAKAKALTKVIKVNVAKMEFLSNKYNGCGVHTFCKPEDLVIFVTPETQANIDVELLASSFHMDKAQINERMVLVPSFENEKQLALIMDKNCIQLYENYNTSGNFVNADGLYTNIFYHRALTLGICNQFNAMTIVSSAE